MSASRSKCECECVLREARDAKFHGLLRAKIAGAWGKVGKRRPAIQGGLMLSFVSKTRRETSKRRLFSHNRRRNDFGRDREDSQNHPL